MPDPSGIAKQLADQLEKEHKNLVVSSMAKEKRGGKVFLDWSQNNAAKTTVCPWSLRGRDRPLVAVPLEWAEVEEAPPTPSPSSR